MSADKHANASLELVTDTGAKLKISGLTDADIKDAANLIADIVKRDEPLEVKP